MALRVKRLSKALLGFNAMTAEQLLELLHRHFTPLPQLFRRGGGFAGHSPFEVVNYREQLANEGFLLGRGAPIYFLRRPLAEVIEVGGQAEIELPLIGQIGFKRPEVLHERLGSVFISVSYT